MSEQRTFAGLAWERKGKVTRREQFLGEMNAVVPWTRLLALIEPHYAKAGRGRQPIGLETMLRIYFVQQWFDLSDPAAEDSIYDSESIRRFVGVELAEDRMPDETTILRFRHLLERHDLTEAIFGEIRSLLEEKRLLLKSGTIVDATIIHAPSSTKNRSGKRDPEIKQTRKGKQWYFGMKVRSAQLQRARRPLQGEPSSHCQEPADGSVEEVQPKSIESACSRRARVSSREATVGLRQGQVSRARKEQSQGIHDVCVGESVHGPSQIDATGGDVRPLTP
jgi:hypothetical protein